VIQSVSDADTKVGASFFENNRHIGGSELSSYNIIAANNYKNSTSLINLNYISNDSTIATDCSLSNLSNLTESLVCNCDGAGACSVEVTGLVGYSGPVSFDYTVSNSSLSLASNISTVSFNLNYIGASPYESWIKVPANAGGYSLAEFYVMKYEAKAWDDSTVNGSIDGGELHNDNVNSPALGSHTPVSVEVSLPWASISANDSATKCEALGAKYHLISNEEWMAIARDIENVPANWTTGTVGSGYLICGNSGKTTCGYDGADPEAGATRDARAKLLLSNGKEIFDFSANVAEWVDWDKDTVGFQATSASCSGTVFTQLPSIPGGCGLSDGQYNTSNGTYTSSEEVGKMYTGSGTPALRGGIWVAGQSSGVFNIVIGNSVTYTSASAGFRCVYRP